MGKLKPLETLGDKLYELLDERKINQEKAAEEMGISIQSLKRYLCGKGGDPRAQTLIILATYFGVSADWLLGISDKRERS